ncbi:MAG: ribonuclease D [Pseudomonadota bacterium]
MNYLIQEQSQLKELEQKLRELRENSGHIAVDTEFLREKTYNARLCLVQLGIGDDQYLVDVLALNDLTCLSDMFADAKILKLFHAARQDMEVLYQTFGVMPKPIFDTQLAAAFCGMDMQIGYAALVKDRLDLDLPKSQARTDWTRRPLSSEQLKYAADDVAHLELLYQRGLADLEKQGKLAWYEQEIEEYYEAGKYVIDPALAYRRLSGGGLKKSQQYTLKALAAWREEIAQKRDIPRSWVLRDEKLFDLAVKRPKTEQAVRDMRVFGKNSVKRWAPQTARIIAEVEVGEERLWKRVEPLDKAQRGVCSAMMKELAKYAKEQEVAQGLLATRKDIESLYRHRRSDKLMSGWREPLVGKRLLEFADSQAA